MILIILMKIMNIINQKELKKKRLNSKFSHKSVEKVMEDSNLMLIKKAVMHKLQPMMIIQSMFN